MLFEARFWPLIADGSVTVTFRRWKQRQVLSGRQYRTAAGIIEVTRVEIVTTASISNADGKRAGYGSAAELVADLRRGDEVPLYRIEFRAVPGPDPRSELAAFDDLSDADVAAIDTRLARFDAASSFGAWTRPTLEAIAANPGRRAPDLAAWFGRETKPFKIDVRKLKNLGLTISLRVGYQLSPRGAAYLRRKAGARGED
jgi:hypothetical protein